MLRSTASRYAVRGLLRHLRRTLLSAVGVGLGCAIGLITISWIRGESNMIVRASAQSGAGHLRIVPAQWPLKHDRKLRLHDWQQTLQRVRAMPEVAVATPRARIEGLLALGTRVRSAEIVGVDPTTEPQALRFVRTIAQGRYLRPDDRDCAVVGKKLMTRLDAELGDELMLTVVDNTGEMRTALLTVVGVVRTGSDNIDGSLVQVPLHDAATLSGRPGAGEITILLRDASRLDAMQAKLSHGLPAGERVLRWFEVAPEMRAGYEMDRGFARVTVFIVVALVLLGVMSAQLAAVLERRRELAVLAALGMRGAQMVRVMLVESVSLGLLGAALGLCLALPMIYYLAKHGIPLAEMMGGADPAMSGVLLDPVLYGDMGAWILPYALVLSLTSTVLAALYPAFFATRTDPAEALRVAQ